MWDVARPHLLLTCPPLLYRVPSDATHVPAQPSACRNGLCPWLAVGTRVAFGCRIPRARVRLPSSHPLTVADVERHGDANAQVVVAQACRYSVCPDVGLAIRWTSLGGEMGCA